jgi:hypothetical protein
VKSNLVDKESFMKFLIGMICGLVVAIAVPVAMVVGGAAAQGEPRSQILTSSKTNRSK